MIKRLLLLLAISCSVYFFSSSAVLAQKAVPPQPASVDEGQAAPSSYVFDLKNLIKRSRKNIDRVNDKIKEQAVYKRNLKREERAREYYQKGAELEADGKLDQAREYYEKAVRITEHPEMRTYIKESERRFKLQASAIKQQEHQLIRRENEERQIQIEEAAQVYDEAVSLYKQEKFHEAKESFEYVETLVADYKATRSYLKIVEQDIFEADAMAAKLQRQELEHQKTEVEQARIREKELWREELERKEKEREDRIEKKATEVYEAAIKLHREKKFLLAKEKFQEVEWVVPNFKGTRGYLAKIEKEIEAEEARLAKLREEELEKQRWEEELAKRKEEQERKKRLEEKEQDRIARLKEEANFVYNAALKLYKEKAYVEALTEFEEVEKLMPDYRSTRKYVARIKETMSAEEKAKADKMEKDRKKKEWEERLAKRQAETEEKKAQEKAEKEAAAIIAKQEAEEQRVKDAKEKAKQKEKQDKLRGHYADAVDHFRVREYEKALMLFQTLETMKADYRATRKYISRIERKLGEEKMAELSVKVAELKEKQVAKQLAKNAVAEAEQAKKDKVELAAIQEEQAQLAKELKRMAKKEEKAKAALVMKKEAEAKEKQAHHELREEVYAATSDATPPAHAVDIAMTVSKGRHKADNMTADDDALVEVRSKVVSADTKEPKNKKKVKDAKKKVNNKSKPVKKEMTAKERYEQRLIQEKEREQLRRIAQQATAIFAEIKSLTSDVENTNVASSFNEVEDVLSSLVAEQERLMEKVEKKRNEEEEVRRKNQLKEARVREKQKKEARRQVELTRKEKAEEVYQQAVKAYREERFEEAKDLFSQTNKIIKGYKDVEQYWKDIDFKIVQQKIMKAEAQGKATIKALSMEAAIINKEIIELTERKDFDAIQDKFAQLQLLLNEVRSIKDTMVSQRKIFERQQATREAYLNKDKMRKAKYDEKKQKELIEKRRKEKEREEAKKLIEESVQQEKAKMVVEKVKEKFSEDERFKKMKMAEEQSRVRRGQSYKMMAEERGYQGGQALTANEAFAEGVRLFEKGEYYAAKARFREFMALSKKDRKARPYLKKIEEYERTLVNDYQYEKGVYKQGDYNQKAYVQETLDDRAKWDRLENRHSAELIKEKRKEEQMHRREFDRQIKHETNAERDRFERLRRQKEKEAARQNKIEKRKEKWRLRKQQAKYDRYKNIYEEKRPRKDYSGQLDVIRSLKDHEEKSKEAALKPYVQNIKTESKIDYESKRKAKKNVRRELKEERKKKEFEEQERIDRRLKEAKHVLDGTAKEGRQQEMKQREKEKAIAKREEKVMREREVVERKEAMAKVKANVEAKVEQKMKLEEKNAVEPVASVKKMEEKLAPPVMTLEEKAAQKRQAYIKEQRKLKMEAQQKREALQKQQEELKKQFRDGVEHMYKEAIRLHKAGENKRAKDTLDEVNRLMPGYKKSDRYMDKIQRKLNQQRKRHYSAELKKKKKDSAKEQRPGSFFSGEYGTQPSAVTVAPPMPKEEKREVVVDEILDLFDPNVQ